MTQPTDKTKSSKVDAKPKKRTKTRTAKDMAADKKRSETLKTRPKPAGSGRRKGSSNKNSFLFRLALDEAGFNIIEELILQYQNLPDDQVQAKISTLKSLLPYLYPSLKEVEELPSKDPLEKPDSKSSSSLLKAIKGNK